MNNYRDKAPDEIFCRSCGEPIKKKAEICPECGVRNEEGSFEQLAQPTTSSSSVSSHDPSQYETTVSDTWWYGVAGGTILWILVLVLAGIAGDSLGAFAGFIVIATWVGLPVAAYFDIQYVRANSEWNPSTVLWMILLLIWVVNIIAGVVYLYRRHEVLGVP